MQNKERMYLNEDKYQNSRKKLKKIAIIIMAVGVALGLTLILTGVIKAAAVEKVMTADLEARLAQEKTDSENRKQALTLENQELETQKEELEAQIARLEEQSGELHRQRSEEFRRAGFSDHYYDLQGQIDTIDADISGIRDEIWEIDSQIQDNESELSRIERGFGNINEDSETSRIRMEKSKSTLLSFIAIPVILFSLMIGGMLLFTANGRGIMAFQTQAIMPVAKEGMQEMAPVMGEMMGTMAKAMVPVQKEIMREMMPMQKEMMKEMGPAMGAYYGEIAKGVKQGLQSEDAPENGIVCPQCGASIESDSVFCEKCGKKLNGQR